MTSDKELRVLEKLVDMAGGLMRTCISVYQDAMKLVEERRDELYEAELAALGAKEVEVGEGLVPVKMETARRRGPGGRRGGGLGRAAAAFLGKDRPPPPRPTRGLPSKRLGKGLEGILAQRVPREKGGLIPAAMPAPRPRPKFENSEPVTDWTPVPPGEGRQVDVDGGGSFEAAGEW